MHAPCHASVNFQVSLTCTFVAALDTIMGNTNTSCNLPLCCFLCISIDVSNTDQMQRLLFIATMG